MNLSTSLPAASDRDDECGNCRTRDAWFLHHVRLRGIYRILCTNCVLQLHPTSFCPSCFAFYDASPPHTSRRVSCTKCQSFTHTNCAAAAAASSSSPYLCLPCRNPNSSFFDVKVRNDGVHFVDKRLAEALHCAARIAAGSMVKAVGVARGEAERKVKEAALARKRAREALEHVATLSCREKARVFVVPRLKEASFEVSASANISVSADDVKPKTESDSVVKNSDNGVAEGTGISAKLGKVNDNNNNQNGEEAKPSLPMAIVKQEDVDSK